jgi:phosphatidylcholine synthase
MEGPVPSAAGPREGVSTPVTSPPSRGQVSSAWAVHGFTALGIVAAMLALRDILVARPSYAILWLLLTLLIDGVDGPIARALRVSEVVPRIDGFTLDLIIDYVACVIVPACFMYEFKVVPQNNFGIAVLCVLVATSAIWFARRDMMSEENWFRGFPAAWNLVAPVMFLMEARTSIGAIITLILSLAQLTNLPFPHIMRAKFLRPLTLLFTSVWIAGMLIGTITYPDHPWIARPFLYAGSVYFVALAVIRTLHDRRARRAVPAGGG